MSDYLPFDNRNIIYHIAKNEKESFWNVLCAENDDLSEYYQDDALTRWVINFCKVLPDSTTAIYEPYYVDRVYRDEYYSYYSKKHFGISRNTKRIIFVKNKYEETDFLSDDHSIHEKIERDIIGYIVIKPTKMIGRALINPFNIDIPKCYVRTTRFDILICGRLYSYEAFPWSGQDSEVMTCAEVNTWQIMEYFGRRYNNYKCILPSELIELVKQTSDRRLLPSEGMTVEQESFVFVQNGLSSKIYEKYYLYEENGFCKITEIFQNEDISYLEILKIYIESGIPVLLNLQQEKNPLGERHCATLIGHEFCDISKNGINMEHLDLDICQNELDDSKKNTYNKLCLLKSWSLYDKYVMMEDHSVPYQLTEIDSIFLSNGENDTEWKIESFVVPLYKHVFLTAEKAYDIFLELLVTYFENIANNLQFESLTSNPEIVIRIFLTTSRSFKNYRVLHGKSLDEKIVYSNMMFPKFIWVCEYSTYTDFAKYLGRGEIVLDATSSDLGSMESVIESRHGEMVAYRNPEGNLDESLSWRTVLLNKTFEIYKESNLKFTG